MNIHERAAAARQRAHELHEGPCESAVTTKLEPCFTREARRPLTRAERQRGWAIRPFGEYDEAHLCMPCRAYWLAELEAQRLERDAKFAATADYESERSTSNQGGTP